MMIRSGVYGSANTGILFGPWQDYFAAMLVVFLIAVATTSVFIPAIARDASIPTLMDVQNSWVNHRYQDCIAQCNQILARDSKAKMAYFYRGVARAQVHESKAALNDFAAFGESEGPIKLMILDCKVNCYIETAQWRPALQCVGQAIAIKPESYRYKLQAQIYRELKNNDAAIASLKKAVKANTRDYWSWRELVICYFDSGQYKQALAESSHLIDIRPDEPDGHGLRSKIYTRLNMPKEAKIELERCNQKSDFPF